MKGISPLDADCPQSSTCISLSRSEVCYCNSLSTPCDLITLPRVPLRLLITSGKETRNRITCEMLRRA